MAKRNDKKVVKQARELLLSTIGNLLESHRERRFAYAGRARPLPRRLFCSRNNLEESNVAFIETGRFLSLDFARLREYLATIYGRNDASFVTSVRKVYDGLKQLEELVRDL
jgi:hypothetical protein